MKQEDKDLLLKYLCAALPYYIFVHSSAGNDYELKEVNVYSGSFGGTCAIPIPYLRPISSMTDEEMDKLFDILHIDKDGKDEDWIKINDDLGIKFFFPTGKWIENVADAYDYLYSIHIDFRGLIPKGLAIEVNKENNPYNK